MQELVFQSYEYYAFEFLSTVKRAQKFHYSYKQDGKFNFGKFFNLDLKDICNKEASYNKTNLLPAFDYLSLATATWVYSSFIAVLMLFSALVWIASLMAEQLEKRARSETAGGRDPLNDCLRQFHLFNLLVERINQCFSPIMGITVLCYGFYLSNFLYLALIKIILMDKVSFYPKRVNSFISNFTPLGVMQFLRFIILVIQCHKLQEMVY